MIKKTLLILTLLGCNLIFSQSFTIPELEKLTYSSWPKFLSAVEVKGFRYDAEADQTDSSGQLIRFCLSKKSMISYSKFKSPSNVSNVNYSDESVAFTTIGLFLSELAFENFMKDLLSFGYEFQSETDDVFLYVKNHEFNVNVFKAPLDNGGKIYYMVGFLRIGTEKK